MKFLIAAIALLATSTAALAQYATDGYGPGYNFGVGYGTNYGVHGVRYGARINRFNNYNRWQTPTYYPIYIPAPTPAPAPAPAPAQLACYAVTNGIYAPITCPPQEVHSVRYHAHALRHGAIVHHHPVVHVHSYEDRLYWRRFHRWPR